MCGRYLSQLKRRGEEKVFTITEFHICYRKMRVEGFCPIYYKESWNGRCCVIRGFHLCYKERGMECICRKGVSQLLQGEAHAMGLSYKSCTSVTMRKEWKVSVVSEETMEGVCCKGDIQGQRE